MMFDCGLQNIFRLKNGQSRSINWENRNGEKKRKRRHGIQRSWSVQKRFSMYPENRSRRDRNTW